MNVYIFQIKGQYAHWRKWFTTTSPLTYSFPPRTAIIGMIGAVLGIERNKIPQLFSINLTKIAILPINPIVKDRIPQNWRQNPLGLKDGKLDKSSISKFVEQPFQANLEILRNPNYHIIFHHENKDLMTELKNRLKNKCWIYQPYMGIMGFLSDIIFIDEDEISEKKSNRVILSSILPLDEQTEFNINLSDSVNYIREEKIPLDVLDDRRFRYLSTAYEERNAKPLIFKAKSKPIEYFHLKKSNLNVIFFESCQS